MAAFKNTPRGPSQGRVCHRIELPGPSSRRRRRRGEFSTPPPPPAPEPAPAPEPTPPVEAAPAVPQLDLSQLEDDLVARAIQRLRGKIAEAEGADPRRIEQLERRLAKLSSLLDERDRLLKTLMRRKGADEDPGVASIYSEVQGISDEDDQAEAKKAMMSSIFEANMALRKQ